MEVYIKNFSAYRTVKKADALSSSLILDSLDSERSSLTVRGTDVGVDDSGNWLIVGGSVYFISSAKPQTDKTVLTLIPPMEVFSRRLELSQQAVAGTIGGFVSLALRNNWVLGADPVYAIRYLSIEDGDVITYTPPEIDSDGCFSLVDYCRLMRKSYGTTVRFLDGGNQLRCVIETTTPAFRQVSFEDGRSQLERADIASVSGIAKLTVLCDVDTGEKDENGSAVLARERSYWYLSETGEISQTVPDRRASGEWATVHVKGQEEVHAKVTETFAKNASNHKLEFWSRLDLTVQDRCTFLLYGRKLQSVISSKRKDSNDNRFYYKAGTLATTATEKIRRA